jgi:hypothetical protein
VRRYNMHYLIEEWMAVCMRWTCVDAAPSNYVHISRGSRRSLHRGVSPL